MNLNFLLLFSATSFFSLYLSPSSHAGACIQEGVQPYLEYLGPGTLFKNLDSTSHQNSLSLKNEERFLKALGAKNPESSVVQQASRAFRWMRRQKRFHERSEKIQKRQLEILKQILEENHVIKEEDIPESFFKEQVKLVRERGGDVTEVQSESGRARLTEILIGDQKSSLSAWIDYLALDDAHSQSPPWVKLWVIEGVLKLGLYHPEARRFGKRAKNQTAPFPELNREALAMVMSDILKKVELLELKNTGEVKKGEVKERLKSLGVSNQSDPYLDALLSGSFKKIYEESLILVNQERGDLSVTKGKWVRYPQRSDPEELTKALAEQGTGWCTANIGTAKSQLSRGDFYIYFSNDFEGRPTIPRIAIRMEGERIAELRGRGKAQKLDLKIVETNILKEKLKEFGEDGEKYQVRLAHSRRLNDLEMKMEQNIALSKDDLRFLYEIDEKIESFGYEKDPRIRKIINKRDLRKDLSFILDLKPHEISLTEKEALQEGVKFHYGHLDLYEFVEPKGLHLPERFRGDLSLRRLTSAKGSKLPDQVGGSLNLEELSSTEGLRPPRQVRGNLSLSSLRSAEGLKLPDQIGGTLDLQSLTHLEGLNLSVDIVKHVVLPRGFARHPQFIKWKNEGIRFYFID